MTARPSRRAALAGSAAALFGLGAPAALAGAVEGHAATASPCSPEAAALQAEAGRISREYREACREVDRTGDLVDYPGPPEAVFERPGDRRLFFAHTPTSSWADEPRLWWVDGGNIDRLRTASFRYLSGGQDEAACARRDEVLAALDDWKAADTAAEDAAGYTAAGLRYDAAHEAYAAFRARLVEMRTADPEVLTVKGMVIADLCRREADRLDTLLSSVVEMHGAREMALALSMARDFIALFGATAWVSA